MPKEVLNVEEAAEFLGFHPYTVREKARLDQIPGRKVGREWRFSRRQLLEWLEIDHKMASFTAPASTPVPTGSFEAEDTARHRQE